MFTPLPTLIGTYLLVPFYYTASPQGIRCAVGWFHAVTQPIEILPA